MTALIFTGISLLCVLAVILLDSLDIPTFDGAWRRVTMANASGRCRQSLT